MSNANTPTIAYFTPSRCASTQGSQPCSLASALDREAQEIASDILAKLGNPEILDAGQIAQLRAEVQRTLAQRLTIRDWAA